MSLSNILVPNDYHIYADEITANNLVFEETSINDLKVNTIEELTTNAGVHIQGISINNDQTINFPNLATAGIKLPAVGGTQTLLNYYESFTENTSLIGPWTSPVIVSVRYVRIGNIVTYSLLTQNASAISKASPGTTISLGVLIQPRFIPTENVSFPIFVQNTNGSVVNVIGKLQMLSNGNIQIALPDLATFQPSVIVGVLPFCVTYSLASS